MSAELPELLSARELCERYPTPGVTADAWGYWLLKWREAGKLQQGAHYMLAMRGGDRPAFCYREKCVLRLIKAHKRLDNKFCQEICRTHGVAIFHLLNLQS